MASKGPRMTAQTLDILAALLDQPSTPLYGFQIAQATKLPVGTVYPVLQRLLDAGWLEDSMEDPATAENEGRPRRRYYEFTTEGRTRAYNALQGALRDAERRARNLRVLRAGSDLI